MKKSKKTAKEILETLALVWADQYGQEVEVIEVNKGNSSNGVDIPNAG